MRRRSVILFSHLTVARANRNEWRAAWVDMVCSDIVVARREWVKPMSRVSTNRVISGMLAWSLYMKS